jgi:DNA primase
VSDLKEIKRKIFESEVVADLLLALGCDHVETEQGGRLFTAQLPYEKYGSKNKRAVQIRNQESLNGHIRNKGIKGDIYNVIGYILFDAETFHEVKERMYEIKKWIYDNLDWEFEEELDEDFSETIQIKDYNTWLKQIKSQRKVRKKLSDNIKRTNKPISENNLLRYLPYPQWAFRKDGILYHTQKEFGIGYDVFTDRITYPVYNKWGQLCGVKGRYVGEDKYVAEMKKYLYLIPCDKSIELYNLHRALPYIQEQNEVLVFESAKSVMLAHQYGYKHAVSIEGSEVSEVQSFLLRELNATIVFCFDEDMSKKHVKKQAKLIKNRLVYAIIDKENLLEKKMSPVDKGKSVWINLYQNHKYKIF